MNNKALARYYYVGALSLALLTAVIHTVVYLNFYDFSARLWQMEASPFFGAVSYLLLLPIFALALLFAFALKRAKAEGLCEASPFTPTRSTKVMLFVMMAAFPLTLVAQVLAIGKNDKLNNLIDATLGNPEYMALTAALHIFTLILAIPAALYFFSLYRKTRYQVAFGITAVAYFVAYTLRVYFDMTMHINNPRWSFCVVVLIAVLLYFVFEVHQFIRSEYTVIYCVVSFLALTLAATEAISSFVMAIGFYAREGYSLFYSALLLAVAVYIAFRLFAMLSKGEVKAVDEAPAEEVKAADGACDGAAVDEAVADGGDSEPVAEPFEELTQDELKRFYAAVYRTVAKKRGVTEQSSDEEKAEVKKETMAVISHLLGGHSRRENILHMREFSSRVEGNTQ